MSEALLKSNCLVIVFNLYRIDHVDYHSEDCLHVKDSLYGLSY